MCACRQRKGFLIEDILSDGTKKPYRNLSAEPRRPLVCNSPPPHSTREVAHGTSLPLRPVLVRAVPWPEATAVTAVTAGTMGTAVTAGARAACCQPVPFFAPYATAFRHPSYMLDTGGVWWPRVEEAAAAAEAGAEADAGRAEGGRERRAGGQVRFSAAQSGALEQRFAAHRYLSAEHRRRLARHLRLTDRQVKTWFQNRRAKWRRSAPPPPPPHLARAATHSTSSGFGVAGGAGGPGEGSGETCNVDEARRISAKLA